MAKKKAPELPKQASLQECNQMAKKTLDAQRAAVDRLENAAKQAVEKEQAKIEAEAKKSAGAKAKK